MSDLTTSNSNSSSPRPIRVDGEKITGAWVNDQRYFKYPVVEEEYNFCLHLESVWWLELYASFSSVQPGWYDVIWKIKTRDAQSFSPALIISCFKELEPNQEELQNQTKRKISFDKVEVGVWVDVWFGTVQVQEKCRVLTCMRETKAGIHKSDILFAECSLVPTLTVRQSFSPTDISKPS
eukprot:TRINITY_DN1844_c0_g1_i1.p1 TRINITY_DN1844_c0_g1~~TRINITY_DN1844_c0_g1_i1.p1  ORF type:complete len:180 (-),score=16.50 TRINITY_DN1844_c0_g1_i1:134-673(-)